MVSKIGKWISVMLAAAMLIAPSSAAVAKQRSEPLHYVAIINESDRTRQSKQFAELVQSKLKYVSSHSYSGKKNKWLASADIYASYTDGAFKEYILGQASIQLIGRSLPADTKTATLVINNKKNVENYQKQLVCFTFDTAVLPTPKQSKSDKNEFDVNVSILSGNQTLDIPLSPNYFNNKDSLSYTEVLETVAFPFCDYAKKNEIPEPSHVFMRLKSYVGDTVQLDRTYSWEIYWVANDKLPSPAIVIRYDCETNATSITEKELKDYFK